MSRKPRLCLSRAELFLARGAYAPERPLDLQVISAMDQSLQRQGSLISLRTCPVTLLPLSADTTSDAVPVVLPCGHTVSRGAVRQVSIASV